MIHNEQQIAHFVATYKPYAIETERKTGISHLFILAQAALESAWGTHAPGNMFFGVKAKANTPADDRQLLVTTEVLSCDWETYQRNSALQKFPEVLSVTKRTDGKYTYKVKDWFKKYPTPEACFTDHALFFLHNPRYAEALKVKTDPYLFAEAIARAGYATAPDYATQLKKIIKQLSK